MHLWSASNVGLLGPGVGHANGINMALKLQQKCEMRDHTEVLIECCSYGVFFLMNSSKPADIVRNDC